MVLFHISVTAAAQELSVTISLKADMPGTLHISGRNTIANETKNFFFLRSYAGFENLETRFSDVKLYDRTGSAIGIKQLMPGEYLSDKPFTGWEYVVDAAPLASNAAAAHVSWINENQGIVFLDDLLPQFDSANKPSGILVSFDLPKVWMVYTSERQKEDRFEVSDAERAVFVLAKDRRVREVTHAGDPVRVYMIGEWNFSDDDVAAMSAEVYEYYQNTFGKLSTTPYAFLTHFPRPANAGAWEADTRGATTLIVSSDMPFKTQSQQRLHEQLRHELFHHWVPNGLSLTGNYDWFYEGFALYISLKHGVAVNRLRFDDFLDTLARAHSIENFQQSGISLIQASNQRWTGANTRLYARGMLVAFLSDIALLQRSKGKEGIEALVRELVSGHQKGTPPQNGNDAVLNLLGTKKELAPIVSLYIKGAEKLDWNNELSAAGIVSTEENFVTKLKVSDRPRGRQKDLLDALGYNNWRKLSPASK